MKYHMSVSSQLATSTEFEGERGGIVPLVEHSLPADVNFPSPYRRSVNVCGDAIVQQ